VDPSDPEPGAGQPTEDTAALEADFRQRVDGLLVSRVNRVAGWVLAGWLVLGFAAWVIAGFALERADRAACLHPPSNCMSLSHRYQILVALAIWAVGGVGLEIGRRIVQDAYHRQVRQLVIAWRESLSGYARKRVTYHQRPESYDADSLVTGGSMTLLVLGIGAICVGPVILLTGYRSYEPAAIPVGWAVMAGGILAEGISLWLERVGVRQVAERTGHHQRDAFGAGAYGRLGSVVQRLAMTVVAPLGLMMAAVLGMVVFSSPSVWWQFGGWRASLIITPVTLGLYWLWWWYVSRGAATGTRLIARAGTVWRGAEEVRLSPPETVTPTTVALLSGAGYGRQVVATLADLIQRGLIRLTSPQDGTWELSRGEAPQRDLPAYERSILWSVVGTEQNPRTRSVTAGATCRDLYEDLRDEMVFGDLVAKDLVTKADLEGDANPLWWVIVAFVTPISIACFFKPFVGVPVFIVLIMFCLTRSAPDYRFTDKGTAVMTEVGGFARYLATAEAHQLQWEHDNSIIAGYLPWVVALGQIDLWDAWKIRAHQARPEQLGAGDVPHLFGLLDALAGEWQND